MLETILAAREERWRRKCALLKITEGCVVSLTLRIPAAERVSTLGKRLFEALSQGAEAYLRRMGAEPVLRESGFGADGPYCLWTSERPGESVKRICIAFEEEETLSVFSDLDVMIEGEREIPRDALGAGGRSCFVCGSPDARTCILEKRHTPEETKSCAVLKITQLLEGWK